MKIVMDRLDTYKLHDVTLVIDIEGDRITIVATQKRKDGTHEIFHEDRFSTPERGSGSKGISFHDLIEQHRAAVGEHCTCLFCRTLNRKEANNGLCARNG